jgi:hypothetical protein
MQNGPRPQHTSPQSPAPFGFQGDRPQGPYAQQAPQWTPQPGPWEQGNPAQYAPQGSAPQQFAPAPGYDAPQQFAPPAPESRNGLALAALICGIVGILFGFIPFTFWVAGVLAVVAIPLALASLGRAKRGAASKGLTWAGLAAGVVALVLAIVGAVVVFTAVSELSDSLQQTSDQLDQTSAEWTAYNDCLRAAGTDLTRMNACTLPS